MKNGVLPQSDTRDLRFLLPLRCYAREAVLQLQEGTYRTQMVGVELHSFLEQQMEAHHVVGTVETSEKAIVDLVLIQLIVTEFISNAAKYSEPGTPIEIRAEVANGE